MEQIGKPSKRRPPPKPIINILGDALAYEKPTAALWTILVSTVFDSPQEPNLANLSRPSEVIYLTDLIYREVQNGGFFQYFYNVSGRFSNQTLVALREIGSVVFAEILEKALSIFPEGIAPTEDAYRRSLLEKYEDGSTNELAASDDEFNAKIDFSEKNSQGVENQLPLTMAYLHKHRQESLRSASK